MEGSSIQFISILVAIISLFGYVLKLVLPYIFQKLDKKDELINTLTKEFTDMTKAFTDVQNHKTTTMTEALRELSQVIKKLHK